MLLYNYIVIKTFLDNCWWRLENFKCSLDKLVVRTPNKFKRSVSFLGSQYICNVGFGFPTLGDYNLETQ